MTTLRVSEFLSQKMMREDTPSYWHIAYHIRTVHGIDAWGGIAGIPRFSTEEEGVAYLDAHRAECLALADATAMRLAA